MAEDVTPDFASIVSMNAAINAKLEARAIGQGKTIVCVTAELGSPEASAITAVWAVSEYEDDE